jgi:PHD/YefM family antitoxin component YafN of YafNO toxin-antitoxin module
MRTIEISTASRPLSAYADELDQDVIILTSNNEPIAAIVSLKNIDRESLALSLNPEFMAIIEQARAECRAGKTLSLEEMKRAVLEEE